MEKCKFKIAWDGGCTEDAMEGGEYCEKHSEVKCCVCGEQATHTCSATSFLVCGAPLCNNCEEEATPKGSSSGRHCRVKDQKYTWWFERNREENHKASGDKYIITTEAIVHRMVIINMLAGMKAYQPVEELQKKIREMIAQEKESLFTYMKENYPSSIINKEV